MMIRRTFTTLVVAASGLILAMSGCSTQDAAPPSTSPTPTIERWSGLVSDYRSVWSAEPGIDLLAGAPMVFRAYVESTSLAEYMDNIDYVYPGYKQAVAPNVEDSERPSELDRTPVLLGPLRQPLVGNTKHHILRVVRYGSEVVVDACNYEYLAADEVAPGVFVSTANKAAVNRWPNPGVSVKRAILQVPPPYTAPIALPPQEGPSPAPSVNVFGDWKIAGRLSGIASVLPGFDEEWPTYHTDLATCVAKAPDSPERRAFLMNGEHPRSDFPTLPAYPGWPSKPE